MSHSAEQFTPATLALLGTTDARNPWRTPLLDCFVRLGVDTTDIFNPVITGRDWDPAVDGPHETFQKEHALNMVVHLGNRGDGEIPVYSATELVNFTKKRDPQTLAAILVPDGLNKHPKKQLATIGKDLAMSNPGINIFSSVGGCLPWMMEKLHVSSRAEAFGYAALADSVNVISEMTPEILAGLANNRIIECAEPLIQRISALMKNDPTGHNFVIEDAGVWHTSTEIYKQTIAFVTKHFAHFTVDSTRDGDLVVSVRESSSV